MRETIQAQNDIVEERGAMLDGAEELKHNVDKSRSALGSAWKQTPDMGSDV